MTIIYAQSFYLDKETFQFLNKIKRKYSISKSKTVRELVRSYTDKENELLQIIYKKEEKE